MATARYVLGKLKSSDGRIRVKTLSGVSALVAVIALLVGVLPAIANHADPKSKVDPDPLNYGGGSGACAVVSAAEYELHNNNPKGDNLFEGPDGTEIRITVANNGRTFGFKVETPGMAVYAVVVNGGAQNLHYDYEGKLGVPVTDDQGLHAPMRTTTQPHNLSHINICYDQATVFQCGVAVSLDPEGEFNGVEATIFTNSNATCPENGKVGSFFIDDGTVNIDFGTGTGDVAGKAVFPKKFDSGADINALKYRLNDSVSLVDVKWCIVEGKGGADGDEFNEWLGTDHYPSLDGVQDGHTGEPGPAIACKVYEEETANGLQYTVVYFEFEDPQFR